MGRQRRPHLPGATFHLTARCQGKEALFTPELGTRFVALLEHVALRPDLYAIARAVLREKGPDLLPERVRSRWGGPAYVEARRALIERAAVAGYRVREIAAYLRLSPAAVSSVLTAERKRLLDSRR